MEGVNKESLCSKLAKKIIDISEGISSDTEISIGFASNRDIRLTSSGQKWIIVSDSTVYHHKLTVDRKRPSNVSTFVEVNRNNYILDNSNVTYVKLERDEQEFLSGYINSSQERSVKFDNKTKLREYFEAFDKSYKNSDYSTCFAPEEYNDFVDFVKEAINTTLQKDPKQYHHIRVRIRDKSLTLCFSEDKSGSCSTMLLFTSIETKENCFIYPKMSQVLKFMKNRLVVSKLKNHVQLFDSKDEFLKYLEELPYLRKIPNYNKPIVTTESTYSSNAIGLMGLSTTLAPLLYNITTSSNKLASTTNTALNNSIQQDIIHNTPNDYDGSSYKLIYIVTAIFSALALFAVGLVCYKCSFQRKQNQNNNPDASVTGTKQLENSNEQQAKSSYSIHISIREESQVSTGSIEQLTSDGESALSITSTGNRSHLSPTTDDQENGMRSTSSEQSITSSTGSSSSQASTGNEQQPQEITTEGSERSQAESLKSSLEEVRVVESNQKPEPKPRSIYLDVCQC
ncbi:MAG: hypothetical protein sL5_07710 [Candidatus Mesenet longicola]|uniref:Uncharacterized protein n=1 Tax=Candidatus Mesenet longicola TaxID=1892558 RepID=A0A8J3MP87_9RICK|nr:MAG: hypothetical protein sGL2_08280 [Candidatus Mesenet longicola]GHM59778.1 MAG: hypothetical protein sL5_07710 [Candidatus Mesenet longicola]